MKNNRKNRNKITMLMKQLYKRKIDKVKVRDHVNFLFYSGTAPLYIRTMSRLLKDRRQAYGK